VTHAGAVIQLGPPHDEQAFRKPAVCRGTARTNQRWPRPESLFHSDRLGTHAGVGINLRLPAPASTPSCYTGTGGSVRKWSGPKTCRQSATTPPCPATRPALSPPQLGRRHRLDVGSQQHPGGLREGDRCPREARHAPLPLLADSRCAYASSLLAISRANRFSTSSTAETSSDRVAASSILVRCGSAS